MILYKLYITLYAPAKAGVIFFIIKYMKSNLFEKYMKSY